MSGPPGSGEWVEEEYPEWRWRLLEEKRDKALRILEALSTLGLPVIVHGSIARGDVKESSDIDAVILVPPMPGMVEIVLERAGYRIVEKVIVQATPHYIPKVYLYLDYSEEQVVSYPLAPLRPREREFYKWGGELDLAGLKAGRRVPGVNKDLLLVMPSARGHRTLPVPGNEEYVASILGISIDTVRERVEVLTRRREIGRTGVFLKENIPPDVPIEAAIKDIARRNPFFRRALRGVL